MPRYKVAHLNEQGVDLVIIPLESRFGHLSAADKNAEITALPVEASGAGLKGSFYHVGLWGRTDGLYSSTTVAFSLWQHKSRVCVGELEPRDLLVAIICSRASEFCLVTSLISGVSSPKESE